MTDDLVKNINNNSTKLNYLVLVEQKEGGYTATVWGLPDCQIFATTREEALSQLHSLVSDRLQNVEIVTQQIEAPSSEHPLMKFAGMYKDNPLFDEVVANIEAYRHQLDVAENPWMKIAGKYKDDPQFDDMLADIEAFRRERDAEQKAPSSEHPLMKYAGIFKDDPTFDEVQAYIKQYRRELDAEMEEY